MRRIKTMLPGEFVEVFDRNWEPVHLVGDAVPRFARRIPCCGIIASGQYQYVASEPYHSELIHGGLLVGGLDVYRLSADDPVPLNKDWYAVVMSPGYPTGLLVDGPIKDAEHWLDRIPQRYDDIDTVGSVGEI